MVTTRHSTSLKQFPGDHKESSLESPTKRLRADDVLSGFIPSTPKASPTTGKSATATTTPVLVTTSQLEEIARSSNYHDLMVSPSEFRPSATLTIGQCFHWRPVVSPEHVPSTPGSAWGRHDSTDWVGVLRILDGESIVVAIRETPETTLFRVLHGPPNIPYQLILRQYFQLDCALEPLYETWSRQDPERLGRIAKRIIGVRLVEQDPWECLISFICSSNNNIPRITKMLSALRMQYGERLLTIEGGEQEVVLYSFPSFEQLKARATESELRSSCGMGYRAKYIMSTMKTLETLGGESYLHDLRKIQDPSKVQQQLIQFAGVGRKVADCVALFSLSQLDAIPVDTHVWNICRRNYDADGIFQNVKSLTPTIYQQVGEVFREKFTPKAGWAHTLLFVAELPSFRPLLEDCIVAEMDQFREAEKRRKAQKK